VFDYLDYFGSGFDHDHCFEDLLALSHCASSNARRVCANASIARGEAWEASTSFFATE
jgi:hypothetical protein